MLKACAALTIIVLAAIPCSGQKADSIRRGMNAFDGKPYNSCSWMVVSGPEASKAAILEQAKKTYSKPDPALLSAIDGKVMIRIPTVTDHQAGCSNRAMKEIIFVDKDSDTPALRVPLESKETAVQNGFGATWSANEGLGVADFTTFKGSLKGKYHVVIVYEDGGTARIAQGVGQTVWSGNETNKLR